MLDTILFGYDEAGKEVAALLKKQFMIITLNEKEYKNAVDDKFKDVVLLESVEDDKLIELGVTKNIKTAIVMIDNDRMGMFITLSLRNLDKDLNIITKINEEENRYKYELAGANNIINPYEVTSKRIYTMLTNPFTLEIINSIVFKDSDLSIIELEILEDSFLDGKYVNELELSEYYNVILIGILDKELGNNFIFSSKGYNHKIDGGDILVLIGDIMDLDRLKEEMENSIIWKK